MGDVVSTIGKQRGFRPGQSGNPAGRPKGARNRATMAAEAMLDGDAERLTRKCIDMALGGDMTAMRLCLERLLPPRKDRAVSFEFPLITNPEDVANVSAAVITAVADGSITPGEAVQLNALLESHKRSLGCRPLQNAGPANIEVSFVSALPIGVCRSGNRNTV